MSGPEVPGARADLWLWAVRLYKTRSAAATACRAGHVRVNGLSAKPASPIRVGDRVEARTGRWDRILEVVRPIEKRVGAATAAECLVDHSPPPPPKDPGPFAAMREPGAGRPTKRERRHLDDFRGR